MLTQYKLARNLSEEEKQSFLNGFYQKWRSEFSFPQDLDSPTPWGCIWFHGSFGAETIIDCYSSETLELQGMKYFDLSKNEILDFENEHSNTN